MIIQNAVRLSTGEILNSVHFHDYISRKLPNGNTVMIDGGCDYFRSSGNKDNCECLRLTAEESTIQEIRQKLLWGTRGKDGKEPLEYKLISTLDKDHIKAILDTQKQISHLYQAVFEYWLRQK